MDLDEAEDNLKKFKEKYPDLEIYPISAMFELGLEELINRLGELVSSLDEVVLYDEDALTERNVLYKFDDSKLFTVTKENGVWVLKGKEIETLFAMTRFDEDESVERFGRKLRGMGVEEELEKMGAKRGDEVVINDYMFIFKD